MTHAEKTARIHTLRISQHQTIQGTRDQLIDRLVSGVLKGCNHVAAWVDAKLDAQKSAQA